MTALALHVDRPMMAFDDGSHDVETEAQALNVPRGFGALEGIENPGQYRLVDTDAVIDDFDPSATGAVTVADA